MRHSALPNSSWVPVISSQPDFPILSHAFVCPIKSRNRSLYAANLDSSELSDVPSGLSTVADSLAPCAFSGPIARPQGRSAQDDDLVGILTKTSSPYARRPYFFGRDSGGTRPATR